MSLSVPTATLLGTETQEFEVYRKFLRTRQYDSETLINTENLSDDALADLVVAARKEGDSRTARATEALQRAKLGMFDKAVPNFKAFAGVLKAYLRDGVTDGWIYVEKPDGKLYPELVVGVVYDSGSQHRNETPTVTIHTTCYSMHAGDRSWMGARANRHSFIPSNATNKRISDSLAAAGIYKETPELRKEYDLNMSRYRELVADGFAQQYRVSGKALKRERGNRNGDLLLLEGRKVIHDLASEDFRARNIYEESILMLDNSESNGAGLVPEHPVVRVFDLRTHESYWVHSDNMTPYQYDMSLREKLILPDSQRDLLDILTTDLGAFLDDIIEGKSAGNIILCRGIPGVGKTLTAEVYAELIERPLYAVHAGVLGTRAEEIAQNLQRIFERVMRWNCVLLLDEADVFVVRRGGSVEQNAIVAEFLRTLEYFPGLMFMTTNRPDDIDEAIISRCAAIIRYTPPSPEHAARIWRVMADQFQTTMSDELIEKLVWLFPDMAPRDIKMLLRLALRVSGARDEPLTTDVFRRCAMFRDVAMREGAE